MAIEKGLDKRRDAASEHEELWDRHGDHETMYWEPGMSRPEAIEPALRP